jgi:hypothetical protein
MMSMASRGESMSVSLGSWLSPPLVLVLVILAPGLVQADEGRMAEPPPVPRRLALLPDKDVASLVGPDTNPGSAIAAPPRQVHKALTLAITGGLYLALYGYTYLAWYERGEDSPTFHFENDGWFGVNSYAGGADKLGHMWTNYALVSGVSSILEWGGWSKKFAVPVAVGAAASFFTLVEIKDGYKPKYGGFSWSDMAFNGIGEALGVVMALFPEVDDRFDLRLEYFPSPAYRANFSNDGINSAEDYSGQRVLLAYHLSTIESLQESRATSWLRFIDVVGGFQAAHYKPDQLDSADHQQDVYIGVTLNLQAVIDEWMVPAGGYRDASGWVRSLRFAAGIVQLPYTTLRVNVWDRSTPDLCNPASCPMPPP